MAIMSEAVADPLDFNPPEFQEKAIIQKNSDGVGFNMLERAERGEPVLICQRQEDAAVLNEQLAGEGYAVGFDDKWTLEHGEYLAGLAPTFVFCDGEFCKYVAGQISGAVGQLYRLPQQDIGQFIRDGGDFSELYDSAYEAAFYDPDLSELQDIGAANNNGPVPLEGQPILQADYPLAALGPIMEPITRAIASNVQVSIPLAVQSVLAVASLTAQRFADVQPPYFNAKTIPCCDYFLTIAESGERKSAVNNAALAPFVKWQTFLAERYEYDLDEYRVSKGAYDKLVTKAEGKAKTVQEAREAIAAIGDAPKPPLSPSIILNEPTMEGFLKSANTSHAGRAIITDEAGAFLGGHSMTSEKKQYTVTTLSKLWDASAIVMSRVGRETPPIRHKRLTMHLMGQSVVINPLLADPLAQGQGFLARFLTVSAPPRAGFREIRTRATAADYHALNAWTEHIYGILSSRTAHMQNGTENELKPLVLRLNDEAFEAWRDYAEAVEKAQRPEGKYTAIKPFASKAAEHALRLAGIFTVIEKEEGHSYIDGEIMRRAVELAAFYADEHLRLVEQCSADPQLSAATKLIEWIKSNRGLFVYKNDIRQSGPNALRKDIDAHLKTLVDYGHIEPIKPRQIDGKLRQNCYEVVA